MNLDESTALLAKARDAEERAILLFALHTGARAEELLAVEWGDLDFQNRKVVIRRSSTLGIVGPTKSGRERKIPMTSTMEAALRSIRHLRGPLVFCSARDDAFTVWQLHERLWTACRRAGLRRVRWHDLRHSFASQLAIAHLAPEGGADLIRALDIVSGDVTATEKAKASNEA